MSKPPVPAVHQWRDISSTPSPDYLKGFAKAREMAAQNVEGAQVISGYVLPQNVRRRLADSLRALTPPETDGEAG